MKRTALFSLVLLTTFAARAEENIIQEAFDTVVEKISDAVDNVTRAVEDATEAPSYGICLDENVEAFAKTLPGKVYIKFIPTHTRVLAETFEFEHVVEFGYDACVTNDADFIAQAHARGFNVIDTNNNDASLIVFNTDKHDEIINFVG